MFGQISMYSEVMTEDEEERSGTSGSSSLCIPIWDGWEVGTSSGEKSGEATDETWTNLAHLVLKNAAWHSIPTLRIARKLGLECFSPIGVLVRLHRSL